MTSYLTGLAGVPGPGYFTDNNGHPKLWVATETWGLPVAAGEWSSGNWEGDYSNFFSVRAGQGFTVMMTDPLWKTSTGVTWDGVQAFTTAGNPSSGLNSTFWTRIDYMIAQAAANGMSIGFVLWNGDNVANGYVSSAWTDAQWQAYGAAVGSRYHATPNLVWLVGNDAFSPYEDSAWEDLQAGLASVSDTHLISAWYDAECTSRYYTDTDVAEDWGASYADFNFCYTYNAGYWIIEYAYLEVADEHASNLLPVTWGDGYFYNGNSGSGYSSTYDRAERQEWWWCLASGSRGVMGEAENVYPWASGSAAALTGDWFFANNAANIVTAFTGLGEWHKLIPDTSSALVTGGRGTRVTGYASGGSGGQYEPAFTNSYVAASKTPDGTLAVLYLPNHTTVTVNTALLATGWTASWIDPITGGTSPAGTGTTFNSTAKGTNSQGDPDWVLVFQGPAAPPVTSAPPLYSMRRC